MSSSRSLASARTKRAGGNPTVPSEPINTQQQKPPSPSPQQNTSKNLSMAEAFGRIGERLNNLELFAETTSTVVNDIQDFHSNTSEKYIVDKEVFTSIVARIETLERNNEEKSGSELLSSSTSTMLNDIEELKSHLIRLQTYVMETNAKLQDMVFNKNGSSLVNFTDVFSDSRPTPPTLDSHPTPTFTPPTLIPRVVHRITENEDTKNDNKVYEEELSQVP